MEDVSSHTAPEKRDLSRKAIHEPSLVIRAISSAVDEIFKDGASAGT
jgi:hypothetical protein